MYSVYDLAEAIFFKIVISFSVVLKQNRKHMELYLFDKIMLCWIIPWHSCPSPLNPGLQEQL